MRRIDEFRRRGFIEGQNLTIDHRDFGLHPDLISQYAADVADDVDLFFVSTDGIVLVEAGPTHVGPGTAVIFDHRHARRWLVGIVRT